MGKWRKTVRRRKTTEGGKPGEKIQAPPSGRRDRRGIVRGLGRVWNNYSIYLGYGIALFLYIYISYLVLRVLNKLFSTLTTDRNRREPWIQAETEKNVIPKSKNSSLNRKKKSKFNQHPSHNQKIRRFKTGNYSA